MEPDNSSPTVEVTHKDTAQEVQSFVHTINCLKPLCYKVSPLFLRSQTDASGKPNKNEIVSSNIFQSSGN